MKRLHQHVRRVVQARHGRVLLGLEMVALLVFAVMSLAGGSGCGGGGPPDIDDYHTVSHGTGEFGANVPDFGASIKALPSRLWYLPGQAQQVNLAGWCDDSQNPWIDRRVTYKYTRPWGVSDLTFLDRQPDRITGNGQVYWFSDMLVDNCISGLPPVRVSYRSPGVPEHLSFVETRETLQIETNHNTRVAVRKTKACKSSDDCGPATLGYGAPGTALASSRADHGVGDLTTFTAQRVKRYSRSPDRMTKDLCQEYFGFLLGSGVYSTFLAVRVPVAVDEGGVYTVPVVYQQALSPTLWLDPYSISHPALAWSTEYRPEYFSFMARNLPAADGHDWIALGVAPEQDDTCPDWLDTQNWEVAIDIPFDLDDTQRQLETYYCYAGQEVPAPLAGVSSLVASSAVRMLGADVSGASIQADGITCTGPEPLPVGKSGRLMLQNIHTVGVTPTHVISLPHKIVNTTASTLTVRLSYTPTMGIDWGLYWQPDRTQPIVDPFDLHGKGWPLGIKDFWIISSVPVPADTAAGMYALVVSAEAVGASEQDTSAADSIWVGDWVTPPTPVPPAPPNMNVFLPAVLKR
jgi:hypothetical protein